MRSKIILIIAASLLVIFGLAQFAVSVPINPYTLQNRTVSTMLNNTVYKTFGALAGNITLLNITAKMTTQTWAGVYGNVSGTITLEDAAGSAFYQWQLTQPSGEIYAANQTPNFDNIINIASDADTSGYNPGCYPLNVSGNNGDGYFESGGSSIIYGLDYYGLHEYEKSLGLNAGFIPGLQESPDGVNETFAPGTNYPDFYLGTRLFTGLCAETTMWKNNGTTNRAGDFHEVLLFDNETSIAASPTLIYTAIINKSTPIGWDGGRYHFAMLLADNGHAPDTAITKYYFFVELE